MKNTNHWNRRQFLESSALGIAGLSILPGCVSNNETVKRHAPSRLEKLLDDNFYAHKEIKENINNGAEPRWFNKKVENFVTIFSGENTEKVTVSGKATLEVAKEVKHDGKKCLCLTTDTKTENIQPRPTCGINIALDKMDLSAYNRISAWIYPEAVGFRNFYFHFTFGNTGKSLTHAPSLLPNTWNHVIWEVPDIDRNAVERFGISPFLGGCPPDALSTLKVYIGEIRAEKVEADDNLGWELKDRIAYCHSGYLPEMKKIAIVQNITGEKFRLYDLNHKMVYENQVRKVIHESDAFYELDFSDFTTCGEYYLEIDRRKTQSFLIDEQAFDESVWKSINFMRLLRCGEDIAGVHSACHLNCKVVHPDTQATVPSFGGWHDAGDLSQYEICTAEIAHAILELALRVKNKDKMLYDRLLNEGKVGISWLLRTRFGDGHRALTAPHGMWRDNVLQPDNDSVKRNIAENGPFENFLASAACAVAAGIYKEEDAVFADWCLRAAEEDFYFAKDGYEKGIFTARWGSNIDSQVCGSGALAAAELYALTGKKIYANFGTDYAKTILDCQKSEYPDWKISVRGFFYENPAHTQTLTYEHRGHEQSPIHGLARLYELIPEHPNRMKWKTGLELYGEYVRKTCELAPLYQLLPAHVYELDKLNLERFTIRGNDEVFERAFHDLQAQIKTGIKLSENAYLRIFPIAVSRRGFHATLLSKAKAVSLVARILNDQQLLQIAMNQIEWVLGKNPFASSTMYGEGFNYHPLYVAYSLQMVGSLPVGIKTRGDADLPYWPVINDAVYKEIWGHVTGKYLFVLSDII